MNKRFEALPAFQMGSYKITSLSRLPVTPPLKPFHLVLLEDGCGVQADSPGVRPGSRSSSHSVGALRAQTSVCCISVHLTPLPKLSRMSLALWQAPVAWWPLEDPSLWFSEALLTPQGCLCLLSPWPPPRPDPGPGGPYQLSTWDLVVLGSSGSRRRRGDLEVMGA